MSILLTVPAIVALTNLAKRTGLPSRLAPLVSASPAPEPKLDPAAAAAAHVAQLPAPAPAPTTGGGAQ